MSGVFLGGRPPPAGTGKTDASIRPGRPGSGLYRSHRPTGRRPSRVCLRGSSPSRRAARPHGARRGGRGNARRRAQARSRPESGRPHRTTATPGEVTRAAHMGRRPGGPAGIPGAECGPARGRGFRARENGERWRTDGSGEGPGRVRELAGVGGGGPHPPGRPPLAPFRARARAPRRGRRARGPPYPSLPRGHVVARGGASGDGPHPYELGGPGGFRSRLRARSGELPATVFPAICDFLVMQSLESITEPC